MQALRRGIHKDKIARGYALIFGYLGLFLVVIGVITLLPLIMLIFYPSEWGSFLSFLIPGISSIVVGFCLMLLTMGKERAQLGKFQDSILLILIWLSAIMIGAVPFMLRGFVIPFNSENLKYSMSFSDSVFESTSGYSSSGLTLFNFGEDLPGYHLFTFYRSLLLLFGGIGLVLIVTSAISDRYGLKLYTSEGHNDKLMPNLAKSARLILAIYLGYIILGTFSYWILGGLTLFDALNHAIAAVATGGFSTKEGGLPEIIAAGQAGNYTNEFGMVPHSIVINITSVILMILGATNFLLHLFLFKGKIKHIIKDVEIRFFALMSMIMVPLFIISVWKGARYEFAGAPIGVRFFDAVNDGIFYYISAITTTGFTSTIPMPNLGTATILLATLMMCIGGGMGSTAGAMKQYRVVLASKSLFWAIRDSVSNKRMIYPHDVYRLGERRDASFAETHEAQGYILLYVIVLISGTFLITFLGLFGMADGSAGIIHISDALFEFASALSGTGLSVGVTSHAYFASTAINWVLVVGMFLGRLEIMAVYFAFYRIIRDIFRKETD